MTTTPDDMIAALEDALVKTPIGVVQVTVDGQTVRYDRATALEELREWRRRAARLNGTRPVSGQIYLGGF